MRRRAKEHGTRQENFPSAIYRFPVSHGEQAKRGQAIETLYPSHSHEPAPLREMACGTALRASWVGLRSDLCQLLGSNAWWSFELVSSWRSGTIGGRFLYRHQVSLERYFFERAVALLALRIAALACNCG